MDKHVKGKLRSGPKSHRKQIKQKFPAHSEVSSLPNTLLRSMVNTLKQE